MDVAMNERQKARDRFRSWVVRSLARKRALRHHQWLRRSRHWYGGTFGTLWRGVKVVGQGGYGIIGLFRNVSKQAELPEYIVVKQSSGGKDSYELAREARFLSRLKQTKSEHFVQMICSDHRDVATGTHPLFDPSPASDQTIHNGKLRAWRFGPANNRQWTYAGYPVSWPTVSRIYTEYCDKGDAYRISCLMHPISEENLWKMWECLAQAIVVLEQGSEKTKNRKWKPIIHFDMKPGNVLVKGSTEDDIEHQGADIFKLADFGLARRYPGQRMEDHMTWLRYNARRGTEPFRAPEQYYAGHLNRKIGMAVNVWGVGSIMYSMLFPWDSAGPPRKVYRLPCRIRSQKLLETMAGELHEPLHRVSETFRNLLLRCLALDPAERPTARALLQHIKEARRIVDQLQPAVPPPANGIQPGPSAVRNSELLPMIKKGDNFEDIFLYRNNSPKLVSFDEYDIQNKRGPSSRAVYQGTTGRDTWVPLPNENVGPYEGGNVTLDILLQELTSIYPNEPDVQNIQNPLDQIPVIPPVSIEEDPPEPWENDDWEY